jgi:glyceraldehyde 3-phosphate dehydrogenase (phosphorylating)
VTIRVGINGFGRIGRNFFRAAQAQGADIQIVGVNDLTDNATLAHLLKYDSILGRLGHEVKATADEITVGGHTFKAFAERDPGKLPWGDLGADVVLESTGLFTDATKAKVHADNGAKKVIISAPAKNEDITIVLGVNGERYDPAKHHVVSNASCTTNGLAPIVKVLKDEYGIDKGLLTTVHAYTNTQKLQDLGAKDLRDARAAAQNIVPSETGAAKAVYKVIDGLEGKFGGMAFRVPTSTVSVVDFTVILNKSATKESIREAMLKYANGSAMKGILSVTDEALVSSDLRGTAYSSVFSAPDTLVVGNLAKVVAWYDNEWGYACRLGDLAALIAGKL